MNSRVPPVSATGSIKEVTDLSLKQRKSTHIRYMTEFLYDFLKGYHMLNPEEGGFPVEKLQVGLFHAESGGGRLPGRETLGRKLHAESGGGRLPGRETSGTGQSRD